MCPFFSYLLRNAIFDIFPLLFEVIVFIFFNSICFKVQAIDKTTKLAQQNYGDKEYGKQQNRQNLHTKVW